MFESKPYEPESPGGGTLAMQFLAQQAFAPIATLVVSYPIFGSVEMKFLEKGGEEDPAVWVWRWIAIILPVIFGLGIGFRVQAKWPSAYLTGRLVGILPTLIFLYDFVESLSSFSFALAVNMYLDDAGQLEIWLGAIFYGIGIEWARRRQNH